MADSPESDDDEHTGEHGHEKKRQPGVKRACNECRQQKVSFDSISSLSSLLSRLSSSSSSSSSSSLINYWVATPARSCMVRCWAMIQTKSYHHPMCFVPLLIANIAAPV